MAFKQPSKAELIARHKGESAVQRKPPVPGFDPGGVVSRARQMEQAAGSRVRVTGHWPR